MVYLWPWLGALMALPLALAGKSGDAVPSSYIIEFSGAHIVRLHNSILFFLKLTSAVRPIFHRLAHS
jgi:hypothetical protein